MLLLLSFLLLFVKSPLCIHAYPPHSQAHDRKSINIFVITKWLITYILRYIILHVAEIKILSVFAKKMWALLNKSRFPPLVSTPHALRFSFPFHALSILHKHALSCFEQRHNGKMVWRCTGAFPACGVLPQGGYHFCSGAGHWPQLKPAQQVRRAKVSSRFLTAGARRLSNLNRNDRRTGKGVGMRGGTNAHTRGGRPGRNRW